MQVGRYLWHTLQAHRVMDEFKSASFYWHKEVAPAIVGHLFKHRVSKAEVSGLCTRLAEAKKKLGAQGRQLSQVQSTLDKLQAKVRR